jgi:hypothetical protein
MPAGAARAGRGRRARRRCPGRPARTTPHRPRPDGAAPATRSPQVPSAGPPTGSSARGGRAVPRRRAPGPPPRRAAAGAPPGPGRPGAGAAGAGSPISSATTPVSTRRTAGAYGERSAAGPHRGQGAVHPVDHHRLAVPAQQPARRQRPHQRVRPPVRSRHWVSRCRPRRFEPPAPRRPALGHGEREPVRGRALDDPAAGRPAHRAVPVPPDEAGAHRGPGRAARPPPAGVLRAPLALPRDVGDQRPHHRGGRVTAAPRPRR